MKTLILITLIMILVSPSMSFWSTGHMIISKIAMDEIQKKDPSLLSKIQAEIDILTKYSKEDKHSFVESAVWADDNKGVAWSAFNDWHFVDTPVIAPDFHGEVEYERMNATWAIYQMKRTLSNKNKPSFDSGLARSFAWRYLIHIIGDIHQPLHASSYYSKEFPNGDRGGNSFKVNYPKDRQIKNLHALWDSCVDQYGSLWAPLSDKDWDTLSKIVQNIIEEYPRSKYEDRIKILDERKWAKESNEISKQFVYDGIKSGDTPSQDYIDRGRHVINEQLAIAGYRLADYIISIKPYRGDSLVRELLNPNE